VWLLMLTVAGVLLAGCVPATPPPPPPPPPPPVPTYQAQYCLGGTPKQALDYQAQHDGLRTVNTDFGAGDDGLPVALPDGRTVWIFADTWTGYIRDNAMADPYRLVRNAFVVQSGGCLTPMLGGTHGARTDLIPAAAGEFFWPMGAFVDGASLFVFVQKFVPGGGLCGCVALDMEIARFALPSLQLLGVSPSPSSGRLPEFGGAVVTTTDFHYFVGRNTPDGNDPRVHFIARIPVGSDPTAAASWRYWNGGSTGTGDDWGTGDATVPCGSGGACPMQFEMPGSGSLASDGPNATLSVIQLADGTFLAGAKLRDVVPDPIHTWRSPTPYGPWTQPTLVAETPAPPGGFTYNGRIFQLPGAALTASYNTNADDNDQHTDVYKVLFRAPTP
jgi:hypothetical protein